MSEIVRMANDIARFHVAFEEEEAKQMFSEHINKFWAPVMRTKLFEQILSSPDIFNPLVVKSADMIKCDKHNPITPVILDKSGTGG